ncbi:RNA polymerase sigma factor [Methylopila jiangsuensis]|uniref:RNA polymerase sigma factor n=1 Tax=Methylopila jiangsuensis TaxID=586230 RepID=A0A9W6JE51_9HYPH|nr:sigma-70 family RNA polymerase sigma factor [Methylopila jiangsuensis]MDR6287275.1 RNA polymerase sigma-70 factor (ECF subfamily) [Methylopila jiangsuensis]GLK74766.1 RNA polymerase sigma factor [Methylopila jiangsuensis]
MTDAPPARAPRDELLVHIPSLRAFAVSLSGQIDRADDLVQETLVKAWRNLGSYTEGTNMRAWLFTILRNVYISDIRRRKREVQDTDGMFAERVSVPPQQNGHMDLADFQKALASLPDEQREALILIGAAEFSYEEAAEIANCAVGTVKSRVNRARNALTRKLNLDVNEIGLEPALRAALGAGPT